MSEWREEGKAIAKRFGGKLLMRNLGNDKFWSDILRTVLNPKIGKMYSQELVYAFEKNMKLSDLYRVEHTEAMKEVAEGNEDVMAKIKEKLHFSTSLFTWEWIEDWWKKDQPKLLGIVMNHPRSPEFRRWLVEGIKDLCAKIAETL